MKANRFRFRAWEKSNKEPEMEYYEPEFAGRCFEYHLRLGDPIMQSTGLTDKEGQEIFEGDVVQSPKKDYGDNVSYYITSVKWDHVNTGFEPFTEDNPFNIKNKPEEFRIIGNIHENPELLNA